MNFTVPVCLLLLFLMVCPKTVVADHYTLLFCSGQSNMRQIIKDTIVEQFETTFPQSPYEAFHRFHPAEPLEPGWISRTAAGERTPGPFYLSDWKNSLGRGALEEVVADLNRGCHSYDIVLFWMQGETDSTSRRRTDAYREDLQWMINRLRSDFDLDSLKVILGNIQINNREGAWAENLSIVRNSLEDIASSDPCIAIVETKDLERPNDDVHLSDAALETLGGRMFAAYRDLTRPSPRIRKREAARRPQNGDLRISEIMFHPAPPVREEEIFISTAAEDYGFIEILNVSSDTLSLAEVEITGAISFPFSTGNLQELHPGESAVAVADPTAFWFRYGSGPFARGAGRYSGHLPSEGGEILLTIGHDGPPLHRVHYESTDPWPRPTRGEGRSLVLIRPGSSGSNSSQVTDWRSSAILHGSPGCDDLQTFSGNPDEDLDEDGRTRLLEYGAGTCDHTHDSGRPLLNIQLDDSGNPELVLRRHLAADDLSYSFEQWDPKGEWIPFHPRLLRQTATDGNAAFMIYDGSSQTSTSTLIRLRLEHPPQTS
ncbi:MAG: sialate O-acetylesterase [Verrucomicrobiota bacterium]